jgi:hypothetical protein
MNDRPEALESLSHRVDELEKRVHALEHQGEASAVVAALPQVAPAKAQIERESPIERTSSVFALTGKAMLGIAGAYLLRAISASGAVPRQAIAAIGIAYAVAWLVWASRAGAKVRPQAAIYAGTSALILAPMLWELTLRFRELSPAWAAGVLAAYAVTATALAWNDHKSPIVWIAQGAAAATALALSVATRAMAPFLAALLIMVLLDEYASIRHRRLAVRPLVVVIADVAAWALIFVYSGPESARVEYPSLGVRVLIALPCLLSLISAAGITTRAWLQRHPISWLDAAEAVLAFALAAWSVLAFAPRPGAIALGIVCLVLSAACYLLAFARFRTETDPRNHRVFALWSAALLVAGTFWCLHANGMAVSLAVAALAAIVVATRLDRLTLGFHAAIYLTAAAFASRLFEYAVQTMAGAQPVGGSWTIYLVSSCAALCFFFDKESDREDWKQQILHFIPALFASAAAVAFLVHLLLRLAAIGITPAAFHVALTRTLSVCVLALALSYGGSRWRRPELTRIAYVALAFVAAKLLFEDLRHGRMEFIAASIFLFAVTLIAVPRLARPAPARHSHPGAPHPS